MFRKMFIDEIRVENYFILIIFWNFQGVYENILPCFYFRNCFYEFIKLFNIVKFIFLFQLLY